LQFRPKISHRPPSKESYVQVATVGNIGFSLQACYKALV
jgi:hypothetical protein